jgi:hypothetical protein
MEANFIYWLYIAISIIGAATLFIKKMSRWSWPILGAASIVLGYHQWMISGDWLFVLLGLLIEVIAIFRLFRPRKTKI